MAIILKHISHYASSPQNINIYRKFHNKLQRTYYSETVILYSHKYNHLLKSNIEAILHDQARKSVHIMIMSHFQDTEAQFQAYIQHSFYLNIDMLTKNSLHTQLHLVCHKNGSLSNTLNSS